GDGHGRLHDRQEAEGQGVAEDEVAASIGIDSSLSRVPLRRSRRVAMLVTRNMTMKGKSASIAGPMLAKTSVSSKIQATSPMSRLGTTSSRAIVRGSLRI